MKTQPPAWKHQRELVKHLLTCDAVAMNWEMGTGKTRAIIDYIRESKSTRVLVVCPKSVIDVWADELETHGHAIGGADGALLLKYGAQRNHSLFVRHPRPITVINYEGVWRDPIGSAIMALHWDLVVWDEAHKLKSPRGKASRFAARIRKRADTVALLSGTMLPHSPLDAFGVYRAADPELFGKTFTTFRARYAVTDYKFPGIVRAWTNQDEMRAKLATITQTVKKDDVLKLPDQMHVRRYVELEPAARRIYDSVATQFWAEVDDGAIVAGNALTRLLRLQQLTSGVAVTADERLLRIDEGKNRALSDILEGLPDDEPVVVFSRFRADLLAVAQCAKSAAREPLELSGRHNEYSTWKNERTGGEVLNAQIQAGGVGVNLSRAAYCVYYSVGFSLSDFVQSLARTHRAGQTRKVSYYHLLARDTVDAKVYTALAARKRVIDAVLGQRPALAGLTSGATK